MQTLGHLSYLLKESLDPDQHINLGDPIQYCHYIPVLHFDEHLFVFIAFPT
jgi:hypothetical protein